LSAAQRFFWAIAILRRAAALTWRFFDPDESGSNAMDGFFGGRLLRFTGELSASIARFSLSRSAMSKDTMWSVGILWR
jgi:hypothetical protein